MDLVNITDRKLKKLMNRACLRKKNFTFEKANKLVDRKMALGELIYFYKCVFCGSYHMTRNPPKERLQTYFRSLMENSVNS